MISRNFESGALNLERQAGLHYNKLNAPVRSYVDNLRAQVYEVLHKYGANDMQEFATKTHDVEPKDRETVIKLMRDLVTAYKKNEIPGVMAIEKAREFLGRENVHGIEDVEFALGYKLDRSKIPPIPYTVEDLQKSKEIKDKTGVEEMLILEVADVKGEPLTGERMNELLQKKYTEMGLGNFLDSTNWYYQENFFTQPHLTYNWKIITKRCILDSYGKRHDWQPGDYWNKEDSQEFVIEQFAEKIEILRRRLHRPEPLEMLYALAVHLIATERDNGKDDGERLLRLEYHWSDTYCSTGKLVNVGHASKDGATFARDLRNFPFNILGACLSRDPLDQARGRPS